jgi:hypothetical protein
LRSFLIGGARSETLDRLGGSRGDERWAMIDLRATRSRPSMGWPINSSLSFRLTVTSITLRRQRLATV